MVLLIVDIMSGFIRVNQDKEQFKLGLISGAPHCLYYMGGFIRVNQGKEQIKLGLINGAPHC